MYTIAPKNAKNSDSFDYTRKSVSFITFHEPAIREKEGKTVFRVDFIDPRIVRYKTSAPEDHEFHSTWIYITKMKKHIIKIKRAKKRIWIQKYSGIFIGDLDYNEIEYFREFIESLDNKPTFVVLPAYGKFGEKACEEHKVPEDIKDRELAMKNKIAELAENLRKQGIKVIAHWHGDRKPQWAEFIIYPVWPLVCDLPEYQKAKKS